MRMGKTGNTGKDDLRKLKREAKALFYTITLNPSIDYIMRLKNFTKGMTNRTIAEEYYIGGKGINVSCVLSELGVESTALGFVAGFTGAAIEQGLQKMGIRADFIQLEEGNSRINVKIKAGEESEINGQGPEISEEAFQNLLSKLDQIQDGDTLILAGAIPNTLSPDAYHRILSCVRDRKIRIVVDAAKKLLTDSLRFKPFLIKPNRQELSEIFMKQMLGEQDIIECAKELKKLGAKNVIVSLGKDGAMLIDEFGNIHKIGTLKGKVINTVGTGNSMVAGFLTGYDRTGDYDEALLLGTACANATAFSPGLADAAGIEKALRQMREQQTKN